MQKNEEHCLEPWLRYHGYLFGFENIVIIDHHSNSSKVVKLLEQYKNFGINVIYLPENASFQDKGVIVAAEIHRIEELKKIDFVFPIDCDEFLFLKRGNHTESCSRDKIYEYLYQLRGFSGALEIKENYLHILGHPGYFWSQPYQKVFFAGGNCLRLDHGFHTGIARTSPETRQTSLAYAHFHFKPYHIDRKLSQEKLRPWVDMDDIDALRAFNGPGFHLKSHLLETENEYYSKFIVDHSAIYFKELVDLFNLIGIDPNFSAYDEKGDLRTPYHQENYAALPINFSANQYLLANPDVAESGTDPIQHYLTFGIKEGRKIR
jgi:hypothetical protein